MADQALFSGLIAAGGTFTLCVLWLLDKIAGGYISDKAQKIWSGKASATPAADRLAIQVSILEAEVATLERLMKRVIAERDYYQTLAEQTSRSLAERETRQRVRPHRPKIRQDNRQQPAPSQLR